MHLDCCFQPLGNGKALIHDQGFLDKSDFEWLLDFFGKDNVFYSNSRRNVSNELQCVFYIRRHSNLRTKFHTLKYPGFVAQGFTVEEVPYAEISKQGGLLRCSTLPLKQETNMSQITQYSSNDSPCPISYERTNSCE